MLVLVTYDVSTDLAAGRRRLRRVAKTCQDHGQRVQKSVFECSLDAAQFVAFRDRLVKEIDAKFDSLRFYFLGNNWHSRVEHVGANPSYDPEGFLEI
jgi:CRISPR-associated protein Cas2